MNMIFKTIVSKIRDKIQWMKIYICMYFVIIDILKLLLINKRMESLSIYIYVCAYRNRYMVHAYMLLLQYIYHGYYEQNILLYTVINKFTQ